MPHGTHRLLNEFIKNYNKNRNVTKFLLLFILLFTSKKKAKESVECTKRFTLACVPSINLYFDIHLVNNN